MTFVRIRLVEPSVMPGIAKANRGFGEAAL